MAASFAVSRHSAGASPAEMRLLGFLRFKGGHFDRLLFFVGQFCEAVGEGVGDVEFHDISLGRAMMMDNLM